MSTFDLLGLVILLHYATNIINKCVVLAAVGSC